jgi:hypothetical protein
MLAPNGMLHTEWTMRAMHDAGLGIDTALYCAVTLTGFVLGLAGTVQLEAEALQETGVSSHEWMEAQGDAFAAIAASGQFPMLAGLSDVPGFDLDLDRLFEFGLKVILDGFAGLVEPPAP